MSCGLEEDMSNHDSYWKEINATSKLNEVQAEKKKCFLSLNPEDIRNTICLLK